jgi:hypothetical protein
VPRTGPKELNSVSNNRELNSQSFETKFSLFGAPKLEEVCVEGAHGNFEPFWKVPTTFNMAAAYMQCTEQPRRPDQIVFDSTFDSTILIQY